MLLYLGRNILPAMKLKSPLVHENTIVFSAQETPVAVKPFIRWAGGKQKLIDEIFSYVGVKNINRYFEPFLGGGSFFFRGNFPTSHLSDLNANLINSYQHVKESPELVFEELSRYPKLIEPKIYYEIRQSFNNHIGEDTLDQAVRFIFLNRTSFNGIYRVTKSGLYNVPFGKPNPAFVSKDQMMLISARLQKATLNTCYYDEIIDLVQKDDLVYLDPPYPRLSVTAHFNLYTLDRFIDENQIHLAEFANKLSGLGAKVVISNADIPLISNLYKNWNQRKCATYRYISCKKERFRVSELVIKNF